MKRNSVISLCSKYIRAISFVLVVHMASYAQESVSINTNMTDSHNKLSKAELIYILNVQWDDIYALPNLLKQHGSDYVYTLLEEVLADDVSFHKKMNEHSESGRDAVVSQLNAKGRRCLLVSLAFKPSLSALLDVDDLIQNSSDDYMRSACMAFLTNASNGGRIFLSKKEKLPIAKTKFANNNFASEKTKFLVASVLAKHHDQSVKSYLITVMQNEKCGKRRRQRAAKLVLLLEKENTEALKILASL